MHDFLNSPEVKIWKMFLRAHAMLMRTLERELQQKQDISLVWLDVLVQLSLAEKQRLTHTRLSQRMLVTGGGVTRLVDRMVKEGVVARRASRTDRRTSYVVLTDKGRQVMNQALPTNEEVVTDYFIRHLKKDELPAIHGLLARILDEDGPIDSR